MTEETVNLADIVQFASQHWVELGTGAAAVTATIFLVELGKGWLKLWVADRGYSEQFEENAVRTLVFALSVPVAWLLEFGKTWESFFGRPMGTGAELFVGGAITAIISIVVYLFIHRIEPIEVARLKLYKWLKVSPGEIEKARNNRRDQKGS